MVDERSQVVDDIGYGFSNPCRYLQQVFRGFLRCLGLENQGEEGKQTDVDGGGDGSSDGGQEGGGGDGGGDGGRGGRGEVDDPPATSPSGDPPIMDSSPDESVSVTGVVRRRPPPRGPISSGGPGQTN